MQGLEDPKIRGSPFLTSLGFVQGKGGCGMLAGAGPPGGGHQPQLDGRRLRADTSRAGSHSVFIVGSVSAGTYTSGTAGTLDPARLRGRRGLWAEGTAGHARRGTGTGQPCFCGWWHDLGSIQPAWSIPLASSIRSASTSEHPAGLEHPSHICLEHPAGLEHPIRVHLGASRWPWSIPSHSSIPPTSDTPSTLNHPISLGAPQCPGSIPPSPGNLALPVHIPAGHPAPVPPDIPATSLQPTARAGRGTRTPPASPPAHPASQSRHPRASVCRARGVPPTSCPHPLGCWKGGCECCPWENQEDQRETEARGFPWQRCRGAGCCPGGQFQG